MSDESSNHDDCEQQCSPSTKLRNQKAYRADNLKGSGKASEPLSETHLIELLKHNGSANVFMPPTIRKISVRE